MSTETQMREEEIYKFEKFSKKQKLEFVYIGALQFFSEAASDKLAEAEAEKFYELTKVIKFICEQIEEAKNV